MAIPVIPVSTDIGGVNGPPQGRWTRAHWEALPDDGNRYEIIDGVLYMFTAPSYFHHWIIQQLYDLLGLPAKRQRLAFIGIERVGVFMLGCEPAQPDFVVVLAEHVSIIHDRRIWGVPDLIVEVLSPGSSDYDEGLKLAAYAKAGVPEYAVIDPAERRLRLYQLESPGEYPPPRTLTEADTVAFAPPQFPVPIKASLKAHPIRRYNYCALALSLSF
jgi:Uma2 family endonuclease